MGRKKGSFKKADKFADLEDAFKDAVRQSASDEIKKRITELALFDIDYKKTMKNDPDVLQARQALKDLVQPYRDDIKATKLKLEFCKQILEEKGVYTTAPAKSE